ncbi:SAM-dependent methyltransferase [Frankia sp. AiPs1]|uniref:SAM-dependent methyltransferase n=1 Tax=Frankia sp. AiPs1 TaxID=573493 RepID=UPI0020430FDC|nr:SAM-dependent methyltransferase [Frankia sp. AiPs1]MCM3920316.1 SAM-dependent methyltransferase [Frankia sp. AiPs1]
MWPTTDLKIDVPHSARMYDYYLGGKDNFPADREAAERALAVFSAARVMAQQNRAFMVRVTRYLAGEVGVRQFLDVGTGIPTSPNLHEVAQGIAVDARVVYADNDPIVLTHARALLASTPQGRTAYLDADLRDPERILTAAELQSTLDLTEPVALSVIAILHFVPDDADPYGVVARLLEALPSGSYLALTHATADFDPAAQEMAATYRARGITAVERSRAQVTRFFDGLELVEPGVQVVHRWRPDDLTAAPDITDAQVSIYGALGRKP